ncbi:unnamed protein product [Gordionus sp. m RMFG-2023]
MTWFANKRIQDHLLSNKLDIIMENRNIVHNIINAIMYLIKCNIAFWGSNSNEGNFMCLIKLMAKTVPTLRAYMDNNEKLRRKKSDNISRPYINLLSYGHVKKITEIIKIKITKSIIQTIKENRAYSFILDGTYDVSKKECLALLVRCIEDDLHPHPVERIIHVFTTSETTGENIKKHVFSKFNDLGLPLDYLVGQSMDGAGNMRGVYKGMQALILKEAPKAFDIWCHAHRLNLVVAHVCGCKIEMKKAMGILDELYNFMNGVRRQGVFVKYQMRKSKKSLKRIKNTTRNWSSSYKSVEIFLDVYEHILASLVELKDSIDPSTSSIADGLLSRIKDENFILSLFILKEILKCTHEACIEMQAVGNDLALVTKLIQHTKNKLQKLKGIANDQITKENINSEIMTKIKKWIKFSFILPYRLLNQLNSYSNLNLLYKYLLTLPTTSCSAERAMSKVKINKTRMRNKISDPFLENLLLISSEIDVFEKFTIDDIITQFALTSISRQNIRNLQIPEIRDRFNHNLCEKVIRFKDIALSKMVEECWLMFKEDIQEVSRALINNNAPIRNKWISMTTSMMIRASLHKLL